MHIAKLGAAAAGLILLLAHGAGAQGDDKKSALAPLVPRIRALVRETQPRTEFATGKDILVGEYRTRDFTVRLRDEAGQKLPAFRQLGPRPGGFYLQLAVAPAPADAKTHVTPSIPARPWTTVTSVYLLPNGQKAIFMTWEAAPGAPPGLAARIGQVVSQYVSAL